MSKERECTKCYITKDLSEFRNSKTGKYGKRSDCIACQLEYDRKRRSGLYVKGRPKTNRFENGKLFVKSKKFGKIVILYDTEDEERLKRHAWSVSSAKKDGTHYMGCTILHPDGGFRRADGRPRETRLAMHRFIMNCPKGMEVDHINHDKLNNRKSNLRICTRAENGKNLRYHLSMKQNQKKKGVSYTGIFSRFKGVTYSPPNADMISKSRSKPWISQIRANSIVYHFGTYPTEEEAALAYDEGSKKYHGEFGCLNFPDGPSDEILRIVKEGQDNLPQQTSKYRGVIVAPNGAYRLVMNFNNRNALHLNSEHHFCQVVSCEEEGAVLRDQKVIELGIKTPLNFPDGPSNKILKIIEEAKAEEAAKIQAHIKDRFVYRPTPSRSGTMKPFYVMMEYNGKQKRIGSYDTIEEARKARNKALLERSENSNTRRRTGAKRKNKLS